MKLHSVVDQITNSSGTTFIFSDEECVRNAYEVIRKMMEIFNVDGDINQHFDISVEAGEDEEDPSLIKVISKKDGTDLAPLMDGLFKSFNDYQEDMVFMAKISYWSDDETAMKLGGED